jgi:hypothetical protein
MTREELEQRIIEGILMSAGGRAERMQLWRSTGLAFDQTLPAATSLAQLDNALRRMKGAGRIECVHESGRRPSWVVKAAARSS